MQINNNGDGRLLFAAYIYRRIIRPLLTVVLSALTLYFAFYFLIGNITKSCAVVARASGTEKNEAIIASVPMQTEYFYLLNGEERIALGDKRMNCDLLMCYEGAEYSDNYVGFSGTLSSGECAVSRNLLDLYGLSVGDSISLRDREGEYRIVQATPAVEGIDEKYLHEGIVILAYSSAVAADNGASYLSFVKDGNGYMGLISFISLDKLSASNGSDMLLSLALLLLISVAVLVLWELLIGRRDYVNFALLSGFGMRSHSLYFRIFLSLLRGYLLPALLVGVWFYITDYAAYRVDYILPFAAYFAAYTVAVLIAARIIYRRVSVCKIKKR